MKLNIDFFLFKREGDSDFCYAINFFWIVLVHLFCFISMVASPV